MDKNLINNLFKEKFNQKIKEWNEKEIGISRIKNVEIKKETSEIEISLKNKEKTFDFSKIILKINDDFSTYISKFEIEKTDFDTLISIANIVNSTSKEILEGIKENEYIDFF